MRFSGLLRVENTHALRSLPFVIAALVLCILSFIAALPAGLLTSDGVGKISIAVVYEGESTAADDFISVLGGFDLIKNSYIVDKPEAKILLDKGDVDLIIELPHDVIDSLIYGKTSKIRVAATNAILGGIAYNITDHAVDTINKLQNYAILFRETIGPYFENEGDFLRAEETFSMKLMSAALFRGEAIRIERTSSVYLIQIVSVFLFIGVAILSIRAAMSAAKQFSLGVFRRFALHKIPIWQIYTAKFLSSLLISAIIALIAAIMLAGFNIEANPMRMILSSLFLCALIHPICMIFAVFSGKTDAVNARTLLGCFAVLLFMLFLGGGFYPVHMMDISVRSFNPSWMAHILAEWILDGRIAPFTKTIEYIVPAAVCAVITVTRWRASLR